MPTLAVLLFVCIVLAGVQPDYQLVCTTPLGSGFLLITTAAGTSSAEYDSAAITAAPIIDTVTPAEWSTTEPTEITITGLR